MTASRVFRGTVGNLSDPLPPIWLTPLIHPLPIHIRVKLRNLLARADTSLTVGIRALQITAFYFTLTLLKYRGARALPLPLTLQSNGPHLANPNVGIPTTRTGVPGIVGNPPLLPHPVTTPRSLQNPGAVNFYLPTGVLQLQEAMLGRKLGEPVFV